MFKTWTPVDKRIAHDLCAKFLTLFNFTKEQCCISYINIDAKDCYIVVNFPEYDKAQSISAECMFECFFVGFVQGLAYVVINYEVKQRIVNEQDGKQY